MDFGLYLPQGAHRDVGRDVIDVAVRAEKAGFASLWAYERILFPIDPVTGLYGMDGVPWLDYYRYCSDPLTILTLAGAATERVRLGTAVLIAPLHNKIHLARTLATLDQATGGRVTAGFGSGWSEEEYASSGIDFARRGPVLDETIDAVRALTGPDPVTYHDSQIAVEDALVSPKPLTDMPILLGSGVSQRTIRRIAEKSDGWIPVSTPFPVIAETWKRILELAEDAGRDPVALRLVPAAPITIITDKPLGAGRQQFQGSPDELVDDFAAIANIGAHELVIGLDTDSASAGELIEKALVLIDAATKAGLRDQTVLSTNSEGGIRFGRG
jgi:probable F420-dependent oxidoreductase